jgi:tetratricopeptide (TPR) repeat protein
MLPMAAAQAGGYDDFTRGIAANTQGDSATAIAAFGAAINSSDLSPALLPAAYRARAVANLRLKNCAAALPDLEKAIELKAAYPDVRWLHARAAECLGKPDVAMADMTAVIAEEPGAAAYFERGRMRWYRADYSGAQADFIKARERDGQNARVVVWLEIARQRNGTFDADTAKADLEQLHSHAWPRPIVELFAGVDKTGENAAPAPDPDAAIVDIDIAQDKASELPSRKCESDFYMGEYWLGRNDLVAARPLLRNAADNCAPETVERDAARHELAGLK